MSATLEKLITPPDLPVKGSPLSDEDKAKVAEVAAHFNKEDYTAPDGENKTTRSPLILREFMFMVSAGPSSLGCWPHSRRCLRSTPRPISSVSLHPRS